MFGCHTLTHGTTLRRLPLKHKVPGKSGNMTYWYNKWHGHIKTRKKKLYIGGIFPISGTKYIAQN